MTIEEMHELYNTTLPKRNEKVELWLKKPVFEREICNQNFRYRDSPYDYFLEQKGLI